MTAFRDPSPDAVEFLAGLLLGTLAGGFVVHVTRFVRAGRKRLRMTGPRRRPPLRILTR